MKYLEKVKLAEEGVKYINESVSLSDYREKLKNNGYYEFEIDIIIGSIKNILYEQYGKEFEALLLEGTLYENREGYFELEDSVFDGLAQRAKDSIVKNSKRKIKDLLSKNVQPETIVKEVENRIFTENDINNFINVLKNEVETEEKKEVKVIFGVLLIVGGIILSFSIHRLFYVMIIVGILQFKDGMSYKNNNN